LTIGGFSMPGYTAFYTLLLNLVVAVIFTPLLKSFSSAPSADQTLPADYYA
jgi:solute:Na+ symporter, SSS family